MVDNIDVSFMSHSPFVTIEQGVQGDAVLLPGRGVSPLPLFTCRRRRLERGVQGDAVPLPGCGVSPPFPLLFRVPPQAA